MSTALGEVPRDLKHMLAESTRSYYVPRVRLGNAAGGIYEFELNPSNKLHPSPVGAGLSHMMRREPQTRCIPLPQPGPHAVCGVGWLWGGARGGGTLANKDREESAPTPNPSPRSQRKRATRGGGEHGEVRFTISA